MLLTNKVILITGAGGGLGRTAALALAQQGAQIILLDKNLPKLERIYDAIVASNAPEPILYPFDLAGANENDYYELAQRVEAKYGTLNGLLHSAVEFSAFSPVSLIETKEWGHTLNVNLNAPFLLTRVLLPLLEKNAGSILFTSDSSAQQANAYGSAYLVSKIALEGFARILANETRSPLRVNILIPGPVDSPLRKLAYPAEDKTKLATMQDLSPIYVYLMSDQSSTIHGQTIDARTFQI